MKPKHVMTDQEFNQTLRTQTEMILKLMKESPSKTLSPLFITYELQVPDGEVEPTGLSAVVHGFDHFEGGLLERLGRFKADNEVLVSTTFLVAEAWVASYDAVTGMPYKQVADDPSRREVVAIAGMTVDGRYNASQIAMRRDKQGNLVAGKVEFLAYDGGKEQRVGGDLLAAFYRGYFDVVREITQEYKGQERNIRFN